MNPSLVYWDAATFLDYLTGEHDLHGSMELIMQDWAAGLVTIATSTLTIAQVYFVRVKHTPDRSRDKDIDALFDPLPPRRLLPVELSRFTALRARELARAANLSWDDAIHVASALEAHCPVLHTTDKALCQKSGQVGGSPVLSIELPTWSKQTEAVAHIEPGRFTSLVAPLTPPSPDDQSPDDDPA